MGRAVGNWSLMVGHTPRRRPFGGGEVPQERLGPVHAQASLPQWFLSGCLLLLHPQHPANSPSSGSVQSRGSHTLTAATQELRLPAQVALSKGASEASGLLSNAYDPLLGPFIALFLASRSCLGSLPSLLLWNKDQELRAEEMKRDCPSSWS